MEPLLIKKTVRRYQEEMLMDDWYQEVVIDHGDQGYEKPKYPNKVTDLERPDHLFYRTGNWMLLAVDRKFKAATKVLSGRTAKRIDTKRKEERVAANL
jgi:hypothetical protein